MTPLPPPLGRGEVVAWRLDAAHFRDTWNSGEGAYLYGGRWSSVGVRAVYCAIDPATAILEVAVHKGFEALDITPNVLTAIRITDPAAIHVVDLDAIPNPNWLRAGRPSGGQQAFGSKLLADHVFVAIPSVVSTHSWNLIFDSDRAAGAYEITVQEPFALNTRLHPPRASA